MFKAGTLSLNMYRTSHYPKDKVSFSPNTVEEQPVTSATTERSSTSHEAIEESQVVEETEVEEEEEHDTDSDSDDLPANNDEEDTLDDLMFLRALLHEMDECLESSLENDGGLRFVVRSLSSAFS